MIKFDQSITNLFLGIFILLLSASIISFILKRILKGEKFKDTTDNLIARVKAWWVMVIIFSIAVVMGRIFSIVLFAFISAIALKEFFSLMPKRDESDQKAVLWSFVVFLPINYLLLGIRWYGLFAIFIPLYAFLFIPIRLVLADESEKFFKRTAMIQWGLMICVYFISYAPAILMLNIPGFIGQNPKLLFFLVIVVELSDVSQYIFGKLFGKTKILPKISPHKTVEGFIGGIVSATIVGVLLCRVTPFNQLQAAIISIIIALMGFFGGATMSAIKRDYGVKDYGTLIHGHGGMLDRIDSLCFAAPIFFHILRYYFSI